MNIITVIKKKIYYPYIALGLVLFIILSTLNYFYKNNVLTLSLGNNYNVSASQYNNYKSKAHAEIFRYIFSNKIQTLHRVKNVKNNTEQAIYFKKNNSEFSLTLILNNYVDDKKLENIINEEYTKRLKANLEILNESLFLYDYEIFKEEYKKSRISDIQLASDNLNNTEFTKKYPVPNCYDTTEFCLVNSIEYYKYILKSLRIDDEYNIQVFLNKLDDKNYSISNIYKDFTLNRNNFDNQNLRELFNKPEHKNNFYKNKYDVFKNSKFNYDYSLSLDTNCNDKNYYELLSCLSKSFDELRKIYEIEIDFPFKIKYQAPLERQSFHLLFETIKILIFTLLITYILFILTNKFLSRKL